MKNIFCSLSDLTNEASTETFFINRLLDYLGFRDNNLKLKTSISEYTVGQGRKKCLYKPDYVAIINGYPVMVIDAKSPCEDITKWEEQCSSYALEINKEYDYNPVKYYILSNGIKTNLYIWDKKEPLICLAFEDFVETNPNFQKFIHIVQKDRLELISSELKNNLDSKPFELKKITLTEMGLLFQKMHKDIWTVEKKSVGAAFLELIKIIFIKIRKDKDLHLQISCGKQPTYKDVVFSVNWILSQSESESPINDILFRNLLNDLEKEIRTGAKKRFFAKDDKIELSSEMIKKIVKDIEHIDFYGMEDDIHGRMFESFLDATARGKELGQYFTPRDVVDLMVGISDLRIKKDTNTGNILVPKILDACCGSGGFLIKSLTTLFEQLDQLVGLSSREKKEVKDVIKLNSVYGIDAGSNPAMYKIARMNMYLHGDGGSNIYYADSLDKNIGKIGSDDIEVESQVEEIRSMIKNGLKFDIILSNPPFSLQYMRNNKDQARILNQYELKINEETATYYDKMISSVMFIERYKDLIKDNGTILAIIDDSVLSGSSYSSIRKYIRKKFIIKGIISLPGDAFKRSSARVKTSIIILKKKVDNETQTDVFLMSSVYAGLENKIAKRIGIDTKKLEQNKKEERDFIKDKFKEYLNGIQNEFVFPFSNCNDRLDVKYCIKDTCRRREYWKSINVNIAPLENLLSLQTGRSTQVQEEAEYQLLSVNYDGNVIEGESKDGAEISYNTLYSVKTWDILISNMGFGRGAIGIVPPYHNGKFVSNEYTILRADNSESTVFYWNLLRTKEILGDVFASTTGMNRGRIKWDLIGAVHVPIYKGSEEIRKLTDEIGKFWDTFGRFENLRNKYSKKISSLYKLDETDSLTRWLSYKSPE